MPGPRVGIGWVQSGVSVRLGVETRNKLVHLDGTILVSFVRVSPRFFRNGVLGKFYFFKKVELFLHMCPTILVLTRSVTRLPKYTQQRI